MEDEAKDTFPSSDVHSDAETGADSASQLAGEFLVLPQKASIRRESLNPNFTSSTEPPATPLQRDQILEGDHLSVPYIPSHVLSYEISQLQPGKPPRVPPFLKKGCGAVVMCDVNGYSKLASALGELEGGGGEEILARIMNYFLDAAIKVIYRHKGDIVEFAGDALIICWRVSGGTTVEDNQENIGEAVLAACECCLDLLKELTNFDLTKPQYNLPMAKIPLKNLNIHLGIGAGTVFDLYTGEGDRWEHLIVGDAVSQLAVVLDEAKHGELAVSKQAFGFLGQVIDINSIDKERYGKKSITLTGLEKKVRLKPDAVPTLDPLIDPGRVPLGINTSISKYINSSAVYRITSKQKAALKTELRTRLISTVFTKIDSITFGAEESLQDDMKYIQVAMVSFLRAMKKNGGVLRQIIVDDKGCVILGYMGLPPYSDESDGMKAIAAAIEIRDSLKSSEFEKFSIGVTTGDAYVGEVGNDQRKDYAVVGDCVNMAARIMCNALCKRTILCDEATFNIAKADFEFEELKPIQVKGKSHPIRIFQPKGHRKPSMIGREREKKIFTDVLEKFLKGDPGLRVILEGTSGSGATTLTNHFCEMALQRGIYTTCVKGSIAERSTPFFMFQEILFHALEFIEGGSNPKPVTRVGSGSTTSTGIDGSSPPNPVTGSREVSVSPSPLVSRAVRDVKSESEGSSSPVLTAPEGGGSTAELGNSALSASGYLVPGEGVKSSGRRMSVKNLQLDRFMAHRRKSNSRLADLNPKRASQPSASPFGSHSGTYDQVTAALSFPDARNKSLSQEAVINVGKHVHYATVSFAALMNKLRASSNSTLRLDMETKLEQRVKIAIDRIGEKVEYAPLFGMILPTRFNESELTNNMTMTARSVKLMELVKSLIHHVSKSKHWLIVLADTNYQDLQSWNLAKEIFYDCPHLLFMITSKPEKQYVDDSSAEIYMELKASGLDTSTQITIGNFSEEESRQFLIAAYTPPKIKNINSQIVKLLYQQAKGNPLFLRSLITLLKGTSQFEVGADGILNFAKGQDGSSVDVPTDFPKLIKKFVTSQSDKLSEDFQIYIRAAAIIGVTFTVEELLILLPANMKLSPPDMKEDAKNLIQSMTKLDKFDFFSTESHGSESEPELTRFKFNNEEVRKSIHDMMPSVDKASQHTVMAKFYESRLTGNNERWMFPRIYEHYREAGNERANELKYLEKVCEIYAETHSHSDVIHSYKTLIDLVEKELLTTDSRFPPISRCRWYRDLARSMLILDQNIGDVEKYLLESLKLLDYKLPPLPVSGWRVDLKMNRSSVSQEKLSLDQAKRNSQIRMTLLLLSDVYFVLEKSDLLKRTVYAAVNLIPGPLDGIYAQFLSLAGYISCVLKKNEKDQEGKKLADESVKMSMDLIKDRKSLDNIDLQENIGATFYHKMSLLFVEGDMAAVQDIYLDEQKQEYISSSNSRSMLSIIILMWNLFNQGSKDVVLDLLNRDLHPLSTPHISKSWELIFSLRIEFLSELEFHNMGKIGNWTSQLLAYWESVQSVPGLSAFKLIAATTILEGMILLSKPLDERCLKMTEDLPVAPTKLEPIHYHSLIAAGLVFHFIYVVYDRQKLLGNSSSAIVDVAQKLAQNMAKLLKTMKSYKYANGLKHLYAAGSLLLEKKKEKAVTQLEKCINFRKTHFDEIKFLQGFAHLQLFRATDNPDARLRNKNEAMRIFQALSLDQYTSTLLREK